MLTSDCMLHAHTHTHTHTKLHTHTLTHSLSLSLSLSLSRECARALSFSLHRSIALSLSLSLSSRPVRHKMPASKGAPVHHACQPRIQKIRVKGSHGAPDLAELAVSGPELRQLLQTDVFVLIGGDGRAGENFVCSVVEEEGCCDGLVVGKVSECVA